MTKSRVTRLPSDWSEKALFDQFWNRRGFFFLDSADSNSVWSQWSYMGWDPICTVESNDIGVYITPKDNPPKSHDCPYQALQEVVDRYRIDAEGDIPFNGGAVGWVNYENEEGWSYKFSIYRNIIALNKESGDMYWVSPDTDFEGGRKFSVLDDDERCEFGTLNFETSKKDYIDAIDRIKSYIREGDVYQVNMSHRMKTTGSFSPRDLYWRLRTNSPAPYAAFLNNNPHYIYSASPESLVRIENDRVMARPIKGTVAVGKRPEEDERNKKWLKQSEKNNAELLMITDLLRNDLGQVCEFGSVEVGPLVSLEEYRDVHHLVSTIKGKLKSGVSPVDCLKAVFPGGSITGAPKKRSMEIINELESGNRGVYTGAIGYIGWNAVSEFNVAIRTMESNGHALSFCAGGGIVSDSDPLDEWDETMAKARGMMRAVGVSE